MRLVLIIVMYASCALQLVSCMLDYDFDQYWVDQVRSRLATQRFMGGGKCSCKRYCATSGMLRQSPPDIISASIEYTH